MESEATELQDAPVVEGKQSITRIPRSQQPSGTKPILGELTAKQERAASMVVDGKLTIREIAKKLRVTATSVCRWKKTNPAFRNRVLELQEQLRLALEDEFLTKGLARRGFRLQNLNEIHTRIRTVFDERAKSPELQNVPGGKTGIVVITKKGLGSGDSFKIVDEAEVDIATLRELRAIQRDAAEELGQLQPKNIMPLINNAAGSSPVFQIVFKSPSVESGHGVGSEV